LADFPTGFRLLRKLWKKEPWLWKLPRLRKTLWRQKKPLAEEKGEIRPLSNKWLKK
jgi:hypothetical protein